MTGSVREAIEKAFDEKVSDEFGLKYLELIYANWSDAVRTLRRTVLLALFLAVGFILLNHAKGAEVMLGPLKVADLGAILVLIPAVTSYLLFEAIDLTIADGLYKEAASALVKKLYGPVYDNNLELLLEPTTGFAWGAGSTTSLAPNRPGRIGTALEWIEALVVGGIVLSVIGFLIYAYANLYGSGHANVIAISASLLFAIFNLVRAGLEIVATN
jgi:hypothetical protein